MDLLESIKQSIIGMDREKVVELTRKALDEGIKPERLLDEALTPGMDVVGQEYEKGIKFIPEMLELFKKNDWELIPAARPTHVFKHQISLTHAYGSKPWISMNTLSIDPKTVCVEAHETAYCEQLDKLGFEVLSIPYEKVSPLGGSFHCTTLDIYREGKLEDYFPKQIDGY